MNELRQAAINLTDTNFALKSGEALAVISDGIKSDFIEQLAAVCAARSVGFSHLDLPIEDAYELPAAAVSRLRDASAALVSTRRSYTHTDGVRSAARSGTRIATNSRITEQQLVEGLSGDYQRIAEIGRSLADRLEAASVVRVTSEAGTDLSFGIQNQAGLCENGLYVNSGMVGNLPAGEAACGIDDGSGAGVLVIDGSYPGLGLLDVPISLTFVGGAITEVSGGRASELEALLDAAGSGSRLLAELGIGLNPAFTLQGNTLLDEKIAGTIHIATGNDVSFGGSNTVSYHADAVIRSPKLFLDNIAVVLPAAAR